MRTLYFLVPGTGGKFACGGLWAELKTLKLAQKICQAEIVTYRQRESDTLFLDDLLAQKSLENIIFVMSWGFDVPKLAARLKAYPVIYHAHSSGYGFKLPSRIPIITVSRNTMGYWAQVSPNSLIYYLPNQIGDEFKNFHQERDIDILVQARKSSEYLLKGLVPELKKHCKVFVVESYIEDLPSLFNRAKIYLYDSAEYWAQQGVSEGFGLQPLEAMACGCQVFSSVNGGLSDYLDPGFTGYKIAGYSQDYDVKRILRVLHSGKRADFNEQLLAEYRSEKIVHKFQTILEEMNEFFDHQPNFSSNIPSLTKTRLFQLFINRIASKFQKKYFR